MKNLATILTFVFAFAITTQAQKRARHMSKLTIEQNTNLAIKKMTLALDLSEKQQEQIKPILMSRITEKKEAFKKRKEAHKNKQKPTADEIYTMKSKFLDNQIIMKNKMKNILNNEQFEKFEKMQKRKTKVMKKKMMKKSCNKQKTENN